MKIYVAGKNLRRAQTVMEMLCDNGHEITYDWANKFSEKNPKKKSSDELKGIREADLLVYLWEPDQESARYEAGIAMGIGKPIIVSGKNNSFFFNLPNVYCVNSDNEIISAVDREK
jgi:hypothetical protein